MFANPLTSAKRAQSSKQINREEYDEETRAFSELKESEGVPKSALR